MEVHEISGPLYTRYSRCNDSDDAHIHGLSQCRCFLSHITISSVHFLGYTSSNELVTIE
jgi:hypothetical protein